MTEINAIFDAYAELYQNILSVFYPSKGSTGFSERNLSVNWSKAAEIVCGRDNVISWFEYQFGESNNKHIDALVWNHAEGNLFLIESKRFSNPIKKTREIGNDVVRLQDLYAEILREKRIDSSRLKHCYGIILADVWPKKEQKRDEKRRILESYTTGSFLEEYIGNFNDSTQERIKDYSFTELRYYCRVFEDDNISSSECYALVSFSWRIA